MWTALFIIIGLVCYVALISYHYKIVGEYKELLELEEKRNQDLLACVRELQEERLFKGHTEYRYDGYKQEWVKVEDVS